MRELKIKTETKEYPIYIDNSFINLDHAFERAGLGQRKFCVITDTNVNKIYADEIVKHMQGLSTDVTKFVYEAGEENKNLDIVRDMYRYLVENRFDRKSVIVALGGGVTGDMAGFVAATFMRGIEFVQIPTTLLSQVDSSVGGKVGVDFMENKNFIGAFYQPKFVFINISTLKTLPKEQFASGMGESIKHGLIQSENYYHFLMKNKQQIRLLEEEAIIELVYGSCNIKSQVVSQDEKEKGIREILNFGHTFGHAVESLSGFKMFHGQCVAVGMVAALYLSLKEGNITEEDVAKARDLIQYFDLPTQIGKSDLQGEYYPEDIYNKMLQDKKSKDNKMNLVLLNRIGDAYTDKSIDKQKILSAIHFILETCKE